MRSINILFQLLVALCFCIFLNAQIYKNYQSISYKLNIDYCIKPNGNKKNPQIDEKNIETGLKMISEHSCVVFLKKSSCEEKKKECTKKCVKKQSEKCKKYKKLKECKKYKKCKKYETICKEVIVTKSTPTVRFVYDDREDLDLFFNGTVGLMRTIIYDMKIETNCNKKPSCIAKKMLFYLGMIPTVRRWDRDDYISVNWDAVKKEYHPLYLKTKNPPLVIGFDYASLGFYTQNYGVTDRTKNTYDVAYRNFKQFVLYQQDRRPVFSDLKWLYLTHCMKDPLYSITCKNGGYPKSDKPDECECPTGFIGKQCDDIEKSDYDCPPQRQIVSSKAYTYTNFIGKKNCTILLQAIPNYQIYLSIDKLRCDKKPFCFEDGCLQVKYQTDQALTGYLVCGNDDWEWIKSEKNQILIRYRGTSSSHSAHLRYYLGPYYYD
uniref:EGF-like domain-containing protein n=1 Tax=Strongyloides papillosus TaxID=174720 RepID=A0A0N5BIQ2_STREA